MLVLGSGAIFEISADGPIARCVIQNRSDLTPDEGAHCAREIQRVLLEHVLRKHSPYQGLVVDVRLGPPVFGPRTRAALEFVFRAAEEHGKPLAVLVGDGAVQRLQFSSLCRECAPTYSQLSDPGEADAWILQNARSSVKP